MIAEEDVAFPSPNGLVFTSRQVMYERWPILLVSHDASDEAWQFVNGEGDTEEDTEPMLIHPEHVVDLDPSVLELTDLPLGWLAWRADAQDGWTRTPQEPQD